ncbi:aminotransferase class V-fold PLP-dependent enzyme [Syntrophomonas palmitatica]|uniref:aminotransferase class V-fold PLP-dependent enzyme n=1 Tax=Syntrophomonas palmitatica TaxID=402877 RepID=UPI0006D254D2|nr:aminotransferase class V-fold PLP-dependent enzyme [Syntrophomonas palmitatica]
MRGIYLDNAATSYPKPESVCDAVDHFNRYLGGNPGRGAHRATLQAGNIILEARESLAALFNIEDANYIAFMSNVTEALNTALKGLLQPGDHVITSDMEHNAMARPLYVLSRQGIEWTQIHASMKNGLDPEDVRRAIKPNTKLITLLHASNLTGAIMPITAIGKIAREHDITFMVDSAQSAGVLPIDVIAQNIDVLAFTGHKGLLGLQGTGGLYVKPGLFIRRLKEGGTGSFSEHLTHPDFMPDHLEAGTPNTPGIIGLLAGVNFVRAAGVDKIREHEIRLCERLLQGLREIPGVIVYGPADSKDRTAVIAFNISGRDCGDVSFNLDHRYGIICRAGLHCAPLAHTCIGTFETGACRLSPGFFNNEEDIDRTIKAIYTLAKE